ncbi:MAG: conjugal transfer protein TraG N-terminal domain-containing protein [Anaerolineae bacterium]
MAPTGFSPADTALVFAGALWGGQLHHLFLALKVYTVVVVLGLVIVLFQSLRTSLVWPTAVYLMVSAGVFFAFGSTPVRLGYRTPMAIQMGAQAVNPTETHPNPGGTGLPKGFLLVNAGMESLTKTMIAIVNRDFAVNPFAVIVGINELAMERFDRDPALQRRLGDFMRVCYYPALAMWSQDMARNGNQPTSSDLEAVDTPAGEAVQRYYGKLSVPPPESFGINTETVGCRALWGTLKPDLLAYIRGEETGGLGKWMRLLSNRLGQLGRGSEEAWLIASLRNYREAVEPPGGSELSPARGPIAGPLAWVFSAWALLKNRVTLAQLATLIQQAAYPVFGFIMMTLYALYPLVLALSLLPGQLGRLLTYFLLLFAVKLWPVLWAMIAAAHETVLPYFMGSRNVIGDQTGKVISTYPGIVQMAAVLMILAVPAIASIIVGISAHRLGGALGQWQTGGFGIGVGRIGVK